MIQAAQKLTRMARIAADLVLPPRCPACGSEDVDSDNFCAPCWGELDLIAPPLCDGCGIPLPGDGERLDIRCAACLSAPPRHAGIYAALRYGDLPAQMALKLKYGRKTGLARRMARLMLRRLPGPERLSDPLIVPVPLHRFRLLGRGFNQAALIGGELSKLTGYPMLPDALIRTRRTKPLKGMNARARAIELKGAIAPHPRHVAAIKGRNIMLVDDVLTSGATTDAALNALRQAGAGKVAITAFARVLD